MPRRPDLEPFRQPITERLARTGSSQTEVRAWLLLVHGVKVSRTHLIECVAAWGLSRKSPNAKTPELRDQIKALFFSTKHNDKKIAQIITDGGLPTTPNQVKEVRLE